ncbi:MAG: glycosyltransferase [Deltaproteobacteria bacterium]|nr:glycosyltransferase [Deltaproteobacteria bacterium]
MSAQRPRRVVYISYDGMSDPLGKSQVLPYLTGLAARGHRIELISFEKAPNPTPFREPVAPGVRWTGLRYHKAPTVPATAFDMTQGALTSFLTAALVRADLVHVRSYVAATAALPLCRLARRPLLFDMRGLWPDERVADGTWSETGRVYKGAKAMERMLVHEATGITVLTNSMARFLRHEAPFRDRVRAPIHVIPTCTDLARFTPEGPRDPGLEAALAGHRVLAYVGSFGGRYLADDMARFYLAWRRHARPARLLVVSRQDPEQMRGVLSAAGVADELVHRSASHAEVPVFLRSAHAGVFFHPVTLANRGAAPTKTGEMLASGLPLAGNFIGDVAEVLAEPGAGVALPDFEDATLDQAAHRLASLAAKPDAATRCRAAAERWFSLERGLDAYEAVYAGLGEGPDRAWPRG